MQGREGRRWIALHQLHATTAVTGYVKGADCTLNARNRNAFTVMQIPANMLPGIAMAGLGVPKRKSGTAWDMLDLRMTRGCLSARFTRKKNKSGSHKPLKGGDIFASN